MSVQMGRLVFFFSAAALFMGIVLLGLGVGGSFDVLTQQSSKLVLYITVALIGFGLIGLFKSVSVRWDV